MNDARTLALVEICREGWANESSTEGSTIRWRVSITEAERTEIQEAFPHLDVPTGHFLVTLDEDGPAEHLRFASEHALQRVWA